MSQLLAAAGYKVIAVEPVDPMREKLKSLYPEIPALKGTSYEIPLPSASQDAVVVAQAFHWFDNLESLREIHRVLKPDGHLLLIWNMESKRRVWVDKIRSIYEIYDANAPQYRKGTWRKVFETQEAQSLYRLPLQHEQFKNDYWTNRDDVIHRIMTKSYIAVQPEETRQKVTELVEAILKDPKNECIVNEEGKILYPHDTDLFWTTKCT